MMTRLKKSLKEIVSNKYLVGKVLGVDGCDAILKIGIESIVEGSTWKDFAVDLQKIVVE